MSVHKPGKAGRTLRLGLLVALLLPLLLGALLLHLLREAEESDRQVRQALDTLEHLDSLRDRVMESVSKLRLYLLTHEPAYRAEAEGLCRQIRDDLPRVIAAAADDPGADMAALAGFREVLLKRLDFLMENLYQAEHMEPARRRARLIEGDERDLPLDLTLRRLYESEHRLLAEQSSHRQFTYSWFQKLTGFALGSGFLTLLGIAWVLRRQIKARQEYERRLADARDAALDAVKTTSGFVASVSHEIRTPMNGVIGMTDLLLRDPDLSIRQKEGLETIRTSGQALLAIVNDILDLSKLQAGEMAFSYEPFSPAGVVESVIALFAQTAAAKKLELIAHLPPDLPDQVLGDPLRVRQVLTNLVSNALKFTETGGVSIHVIRRREMEPEGRVCLRFDVRDTGPGISRENQARLFQPFVQVDDRLARRHGGTGLGLAVSRELLQRMKGTLGVDSLPGKGSTFWFTVTLGSSDETARLRPLSQRSLVVVEDRPMTAEALRVHAEAWKMRPLIYASEGQVPEVNPVDSAPVLENATVVVGTGENQDWLGLVKRLRTREWLRDTPIFLLTDRMGWNDEALAQAGVSGLLHYPLRPSELYQRVAGLAEEPGLPPPRPNLRLRSARIILADDNPVNQRVLTGQLRHLGMSVVVCQDGREVIDRVIEGAGDLVLMDVQMPEMDGMEAAREIRCWEGANGMPAIPIIAVTAHVMSGDAEECLQSGMNGYLPKPVEMHRLEQVLAQWLGTEDSPEPETGAPAASLGGLAAETDERIDEARLRSCLTGDTAEVADLVDSAIGQVAQMLERMGRALQAADAEDWCQAAHRGRGTASTLGFAQLAGLFEEAEFGAAAARPELLEKMRAAIPGLTAALRRRGYLPPSPPTPS